MPASPNPGCWFEIPVTDMARAKAFYSAAFDLPLEDLEMGPGKMAVFPMSNETYGAAGALVESEGYTPSHSGTVIYFSVPTIEPALEAIASAGGKGLTPKIGIGEHGFIAHFEDSEGNRVALHERPTK